MQHITIESRIEWGTWIEGAESEAGRTKELLTNLKAQNQIEQCRPNLSHCETGEEDDLDAPNNVQEIDPEFELNENRRILNERDTSFPINSNNASKSSFRHIVSYSVMKKNKEHYKQLDTMEGILSWTDSYGSTAAHHAAFMKLTRSVEALRELGASMWHSNRGGGTPAALMDGFTSLKEDGSPEFSAEDFDLHSTLCNG